jgi:hypothetical protein
LTRERIGVRRSEAHLYAVTNKAKGVTYNVRFTRHPLVCKHLAAVVMFLRGIQEMRRQAAAVSEHDGND